MRKLVCDRCPTCGQRIKTIGVFSEHLPTRFWSKVEIGGPDECWPWTGSRNKKGYGNFQMNGVSAPAHRVAWTLMNEEISTSLVVRHTCDNPPCCNPGHLLIGTHTENMQDMVSRGRHVGSRGYKRIDGKMTKVVSA